jgi:hypothetical protein
MIRIKFEGNHKECKEILLMCELYIVCPHQPQAAHWCFAMSYTSPVLMCNRGVGARYGEVDRNEQGQIPNDVGLSLHKIPVLRRRDITHVY